MKTLYVSDDGKLFTNPEECKEYEQRLNEYEVEVVDSVDANDYHFTQSLDNKQNCQHFVATYIHNHLRSYADDENGKFKDFFFNTKITVKHKGERKSYMLIDLIEEVPAHYKINSERFHNLIR